MIKPNLDGIEHINIYTKGSTELGRMLSNLYDRDFVVPGYGSFKSMEGFWYFYLTGCKFPEFHNYRGFSAKSAGKACREHRIDKDGLSGEDKEVILEAIRCKLRQNRDILTLLRDSELPFKHYYFYGDVDNAKVVELPQFDWMLDEFERLRQLLKESWN